jgi:hypothetical protein
MPSYVTKALQRFEHPTPSKPQHSPKIYTPPPYSAKDQTTLPPDTSPAISARQVKRLQQIVGTFLNYAPEVVSIMLVTLGTLSPEQSKATTNTLDHANQFVKYASTHSDATISYSISPMIITIHRHVSCLSDSDAFSPTGGIFYLSSLYQPSQFSHPISDVLKPVMAFTAEADLAAIYYNSQDA